MKNAADSKVGAARRTAAIATKRATWFEIGAVVLLICASMPSLSLLGCSLLWGSEYQKLAQNRRDAKQTATEYETDLFQQTAFYAQLVPVVLFIMWRSGDSWSRFGLVKPEFGKDLLIGFGLWLALATLAAPLAMAFRRLHPWQGFYPVAIPWYRAMVLLGYCCAIGVWQELAFRAYLIPRLETAIGSTWKAVMFSVVLFGFVHHYDGYYGVIHGAVGGAVWGIAFCFTRRIWPLALSHAIIDFVILTHSAEKIGV